ncbi:glycosyltransferase 87 family protein [Streptomyces sp. MST-110588]|uniref:glycosyltransferase 87 family protein n=1 Tax=Streptomyces sp. MST-110588 TaxID=2833628 RepID=UPI001F5D6864|nr:glycosyltransferase 87 family protein [Streptomyces sp. MST-110588]
MLCVFKVLVTPGPDVTGDISVIYRGWYEILRTGAFPADDVAWQYPPAAAAAVLAPGLLPFLDYAPAFFALACATDAGVLALFLYAGRRPGRRPAGAWVWVTGVFLLGPTAYARYDLLVTAVAVAALFAAGRRPRTAAALAAVGALLKVWPALLLCGTTRGHRTRVIWGTALLTCGALAGAGVATMPGALAFLSFQRDRGTEVESLGALAFHVARCFGWDGRVLLHYGSVEFVGPYVSLVSGLALVLSGAALGWLVRWRLRARELTATALPDTAFTAVLLFTTTSRVISPQYMIWLVGLAAVCVSARAGRQGWPAALVLAATGVTFAEFPVGFAHVVAGDGTGIALLVLRNGLLVAATLLSCRCLWRSTVTAAAPAGHHRAPGPRSAPGSGPGTCPGSGSAQASSSVR